MSHLTADISDKSDLAGDLSCYLQSAADVSLAQMSLVERKYQVHYSACLYHYQLPLGKLSLLRLTLYVPADSSEAVIEAARMATIKASLAWYKASLPQTINNESINHDVLVVDVQRMADTKSDYQTDHERHDKLLNRIEHGFGARYFMEHLVVDMDDCVQRLQIFSWHDWHLIQATLQTPCELWRFLSYHLAQLQSAIIKQVSSFESEAALVTQFLQSPSLFAPAIAVDNALIKYDIQDKPTPALVAMTLAYKSQSTTAQMYHQHMAQAAALWSQLSAQMIGAYDSNQRDRDDKTWQETERGRWQQQLLDESLFSRHELVRNLYRYPKQDQALQQAGYVVHQHSYERLGRHYVLIFYGQDANGLHSKAAIQPNLAKIAQDVATRLPLIELHHVIVLGIDFIVEDKDTFMDIDLWIQPVDTMTQRERQLTKQLQQLKQQSLHHSEVKQKKEAKQKNVSESGDQADSQDLATDPLSSSDKSVGKSPQVHLNLFIPARKDTR